MKEELLNKELEIMVNSKSKLEDTEAGHKAEMGDTVDLAFEGFVDVFLLKEENLNLIL